MGDFSRRTLLRDGFAAAAGAGAVYLSRTIPKILGPDRLPIDGGYAATADLPKWTRRGSVGIHWFAETTEPTVALTFDDGPAPHWTPIVLDALDAAAAPATFFMVGRQLRTNRTVVEGRLDRHDVGNHTWSHADLARLGPAAVRRELQATHDEIAAVTGREPILFRPPWGHLGGSTILAANDMNYEVVLWSVAISSFNPQDPVDGLVQAVVPGTIILMHDVGDPQRLPGLRRLGDIITGLRDRGFRLVTVSELLSAQSAAV